MKLDQYQYAANTYGEIAIMHVIPGATSLDDVCNTVVIKDLAGKTQETVMDSIYDHGLRCPFGRNNANPA